MTTGTGWSKQLPVARTVRPSTTTESRSNFSLSSTCHCARKVAGASTRSRWRSSLTSWAMTMPASIVFPSPTSSASMQPPLDKASMANTAASSWWGFRSTLASESARITRACPSEAFPVSSSAHSRWWKRVSARAGAGTDS